MVKKSLADSFSKNVLQRQMKKDDSNKILGAEIRLNRIDLELTLKNLAYKTCSVSYVSKVETNSIEGKPQYLAEICEKVNINGEDIDKIKDAKKTCERLIDLVYSSNVDQIKGIYENIKTYKNFRHLIIGLYYFFYNKDFLSFEQVSTKIAKIMSTLNDIDFSLYGFICAKYQIEKNNASEAMSILEELEKYGSENDKLNCLINYELLNLYFKSNNIKFFKVYENILESSKKIKNVLYVQSAYQLENLFFVQNKVINQLSNLYIDITNEHSTLYEDLQTLSKSIETYKMFFNYFVSNENNYNDLNVSDKIFLDYVDLKPRDVYKSVDFVINKCLPLAYKENNEFYITFYTLELENFYKENTRYKRYFEVETTYKEYLAKKYM